MARPGNGTIIVKKIKKGGHGHHGGAWKVAYADFVTAMMAFFLLLWLLNVTTDVQKRGIADYFSPSISMKSEFSGSGGMLGGKVLGDPGALTADSAEPGVSVPIPAELEPDDGEEGEENGDPNAASKPGKPDHAAQPSEANAAKPDHALSAAQARAELAADLAKISAAATARPAALREEKQFAAAQYALRQAIQDTPDLKNLAQNLIVDRTPDGLRIQLVDQDKLSMFSLGSSEMSEPGKKLMALIADVVQRLPNQISVAGDTDGTPFAKGGNYGNWELSSDRANASRRALLVAGLPAARIAKVVGVADRDPLLPDQPADPRNRRISIVLLRGTTTRSLAQMQPPAGGQRSAGTLLLSRP